jgi:hypothetical protein
MDGTATFTMKVSSIAMKAPVSTTASPSQALMPARSAAVPVRLALGADAGMDAL